MLSHACSSCGKVLDASSRTYSGSLHMWIARCSRCGFAVRWAPRAAREPARVWARLRALNLRLGIATGTLQLGVLLLLFAGGYLDDRIRNGISVRDFNSLLEDFGPSLVAAVIAGVFIGACAGTIAPTRRIASAFIVAWVPAAALIFVVALLLLNSDAGPSNFWSECRRLVSRHLKSPSAVTAVLLTAIVSSAVAAVVVRFAARRIVTQAVRRAARQRRQTLAPMRGPAPRPTGANP